MSSFQKKNNLRFCIRGKIFIFPLLLTPFILVYLIALKEKVLILFKNTQILALLIFIISLSITKNIVQSGCGIYPIKSTCLSKNYLSWSPGIKYIDKNSNGLKAYGRGYNSYTKNTDDIKKYMASGANHISLGTVCFKPWKIKNLINISTTEL